MCYEYFFPACSFFGYLNGAFQREDILNFDEIQFIIFKIGQFF